MGRFGHEFLEFELTGDRLRYANNSKCVGPSARPQLTLRSYRSAASCLSNCSPDSNDSLIRKELYLSPIAISEMKRIIADSEIVKEEDTKCLSRPTRPH